MAPSRRLWLVMASATLVVALAVPVHAQGKSNGKGNAHKGSPPSSSPLPNPVIGPATSGSPLAWLDDASLLSPGSTSLTIGIARWSGTDLSEVNFPIVDAAVGVTPRFQIGASVPFIVGSADGTGPVGGVGTSYFSGKIALPTGGSSLKLAISPVLEILGAGAAQTLAPDSSRVQVGLPVSAELGQDRARVFASTGFFSRGVWFAGGGVSVQATPKVGTSVSFTRSWSGDSTTGVSRSRAELSGGAAYAVKPWIAVYGALGRTIGTTDDNGAGTTISGGVSFLFDTRVTR